MWSPLRRQTCQTFRISFSGKPRCDPVSSDGATWYLTSHPHCCQPRETLSCFYEMLTSNRRADSLLQITKTATSKPHTQPNLTDESSLNLTNSVGSTIALLACFRIYCMNNSWPYAIISFGYRSCSFSGQSSGLCPISPFSTGSGRTATLMPRPGSS